MLCTQGLINVLRTYYVSTLWMFVDCLVLVPLLPISSQVNALLLFDRVNQ